MVRAPGLHPLGCGDPALLGADGGHAEVAEAGTPVGDDGLFGLADDAQPFEIDLSHEQRSPMAEDVIVVRSLAGVNQIQRVAVSDPVLLRVVIAERLAVVEGPLLIAVVMQAILGAGDESAKVVTQREEELAVEAGQRRLVQAASSIFSL